MPEKFIEFNALGVPWRINISAGNFNVELLTAEIKTFLAEYDQAYSRFRPDSIISKMAIKAGSYKLPDNAETLLSTYAALYQLTDGLITPLIGQVLVDAGYDSSYTLQQQKTLVSPAAWEDVLSYEFPVLTTTKPVLLDFGGAGKGYAIDLIANIIRQHNIKTFVIDASGDLWRESSDNAPLTIGLEDPSDSTSVIGTASIGGNVSLCASSGSRRQWSTFTHLINPKTLQSPTSVLGVWITAGSALIADAIATSLFFVEPAALIDHFSFEYLILHKDRSATQSANFPAELF